MDDNKELHQQCLERFLSSRNSFSVPMPFSYRLALPVSNHKAIESFMETCKEILPTKKVKEQVEDLLKRGLKLKVTYKPDAGYRVLLMGSKGDTTFYIDLLHKKFRVQNHPKSLSDGVWADILALDIDAYLEHLNISKAVEMLMEAL